MCHPRSEGQVTGSEVARHAVGAYNPRMPATFGCAPNPRIRALRPAVAILLAVLSLTQVSPANLVSLAMLDGDLVARAIPFQMRLRGQPISADLDGDGGAELLVVSSGQASIRRGEEVVWSSPVEWDVRHARITDLNQDAAPEIALLLWRDFAPWPIDDYLVSPGRISDFHDSADRACHLILVGWRHHRFEELWAGSALSRPVVAFEPADIDGDGDLELAALEAGYDDPPGRVRSVSVWGWNGFGFTLEARSEAALVSRLLVLEAPAAPDVLLVQGAIWR